MNIVRVNQKNWKEYRNGILYVEEDCFHETGQLADEKYIKNIITDDNSINLLAIVDDRVIASLYGLKHDGNFHIESIGVREKYRSKEFNGRKIASALMDELINELKKQGIKKITQLSNVPDKLLKSKYNQLIDKKSLDNMKTEIEKHKKDKNYLMKAIIEMHL